MVLLSAGNLSISQSGARDLAVEKLPNGPRSPSPSGNATSMFDAARVLGMPCAASPTTTAPALRASGLELQRQLIFGGQIAARHAPVLGLRRGNFIEATRETCYFRSASRSTASRCSTA
jgi:putative proteasome-type protease